MGQAGAKEEDYSVLEWKDEKVPGHLLNKPLKRCRFRASHNTYIADTQIGGNASIFEVLRVVSLGCRVIELDVSKNIDGTITVGHGGHGVYVTTTFPFLKCCRVLSKWAWKKSDYPLILCLERSNIELSEIMPVLAEAFGNRLYTGKVSIDTPIKVIARKLVVYPKGEKGFISIPQPDLAGRQIHPDKSMLRIYPRNFLHSYNYDPLPAFERGVQVIAMNWNTEDAHLVKYARLIRAPIV
jgi:hypothetical protein